MSELPHSRFERKKNDLHTSLTITLKEALLGFEKEFKHLDDHIVTVKKNTVTQPGEIIKVAREGMPIYERSAEKGDLFIKMVVTIPSNLTDAQRERIYHLFSRKEAL